MDLTKKTVVPFEGDLVNEGETEASVLDQVEETIEETARIVRLPLDKYIVDYLSEEAEKYESESPLYNFSLTMNEAIYSLLSEGQDIGLPEDASEANETQSSFDEMDKTAEKLYVKHCEAQKAKGLMQTEYMKIPVVISTNLYAKLMKSARAKGIDVADKINECMYQYIYLDRVYSLSAVEDELN